MRWALLLLACIFSVAACSSAATTSAIPLGKRLGDAVGFCFDCGVRITGAVSADGRAHLCPE